ncbi:hypothetical protein FRX31_025946 [Thalictrum thalictroides]|uniref:Tetratricopeptide repeat (TPR)-like superfamily protein n=1 Tax=Thalictrum thalictroides TaxID=46969 RepID=A0A7J6VI94_THATH|nr:hypothetical protein FRX31_025946 [Thalictrum thalictroides]
MGTCACKAPISNLLLHPSITTSSKPLNSKTLSSSSSSKRRLFLLSIPVSTTLLLFPIINLPPFSIALPEFDPVTSQEKEASASMSQRVLKAIELLDKGREFQALGDFTQALNYFSQVVSDYKDFAFSDYARVGRALALYEVGNREEAISEMEDVSISLKGYPEVHAALAAALYVDKNAPLLAENQFAIATLLDPHYTDLTYVRETKHWPPSLVSSLRHFITLS